MEYWSKPYSADGECYAVRNISDKPLTVIQVLDYSGNVSPFARPWDSGKELPFVVKPGENLELKAASSFLSGHKGLSIRFSNGETEFVTALVPPAR